MFLDMADVSISYHLGGCISLLMPLAIKSIVGFPLNLSLTTRVITNFPNLRFLPTLWPFDERGSDCHHELVSNVATNMYRVLSNNVGIHSCY